MESKNLGFKIVFSPQWTNNLKIKCYYIDCKLLEDNNSVLPQFFKFRLSGNQWMLNNYDWRGEAEKEEETKVKKNSKCYYQRSYSLSWNEK